MGQGPQSADARVRPVAVELRWSHGTARISTPAAMLAEAALDLGDRRVRPFARAPWSADDAPAGTPGHVRHLGGDFVGLPFGSAVVPPDAVGGWSAFSAAAANDPVHGAAAELDWTVIEQSSEGVVLALDLPDDPWIARLERTVRGVAGRPALTMGLRILARAPGRVPLGLHPILALPDTPRTLRVEAAFDRAIGYPARIDPVRSRVPAGAETSDLAEWGADLLPGDAPREDVVLLVGVRGPLRVHDLRRGTGVELDWDRTVLPNALLWISDRGIDDAPWDGRYRGLGIEPVAAAFDFPPEVSVAANPLAARGIRTAVDLDPEHPLSVELRITAFRAAVESGAAA